MAGNFYSNLEADLAAGAMNVVALVSPDPQAFGLSATFIAEYEALAVEFCERWRETTEPISRTSVAVAAKRDLKRRLKKASTRLAAITKATLSVTDAQLVSLGLTPRAVRRAKPVPSLPPRVRVTSVVGRGLNLRISDAELPTSRARATGARGAEIFLYVGEAAPTDSRAYQFNGLATRATYSVTLPNSAPSGATVWISARWVTDRGQTSMSSAPISTTIPGGHIRAAA